MKFVAQLLVAALACSRVAFAQDHEEDEEYKVKGNADAKNQTTPQVREGDHVVHFITVGKAANNFYPNSIRAARGDIVMFQFYPTNHSVIRAAYGYPCVPYDYVNTGGGGGVTFDSGFHPVASIEANPPSWNLTINDTQPIFFYCGAKGSCTDWGMVGVINANASTPISNQIGLAREADYMLLPGEPFPNEAQQASMASLAATATTATFTITATPAEESGEYGEYGSDGDDHDEEYHEDHGLSSGATAGIAVGSAIGAVAAVGLIWLMLRTRSLKKRLDAQQVQQNPHPPGPMSPMAQYGPGANFAAHQSRQMSGLPPYQAGADMYKPPEEGYAASDVPSRGMSPHHSVSPYNMQGQFVGFDGQQNNRYTTHSELGGAQQPFVELAAPRPGSPYSPH